MKKLSNSGNNRPQPNKGFWDWLFGGGGWGGMGSR